MTYPIDKLGSAVGEELFASDWVTVELADELAFQRATFVREDYLGFPASNNDPYGDQLLSGFLLLSMLVAFHKRYLPVEMGDGYALNYGVDRVRFLRPVMAGQRLRCRAVLTDLAAKGDGQYRCVTTNTLEVEGADEPAMIADWITYLVGGVEEGRRRS